MAIRSSVPPSVSTITARRRGEDRGAACALRCAGQNHERIARKIADSAEDSEARAGWARDAIGLI
jgi:hypothetical protein